MQLSFYLQPLPPEPELVIKEYDGGMVYGWRCDKDGIYVFGESRKLAVSNWQKAHQAEYGSSMTH